MGTISVAHLGKAYKQYPTRWSRLIEWFDPRRKPRHHKHWVLQDINFTVTPGEAVGIIGLNGAGKSTLLKMITGTTQPTTGSVYMNGRVAALLELGMGFHPDFTGRQNAYMAGQLLGYSIEDIARLMPEIEDFAEIGEYIDQPIRVYSSGMQMRLAFSVATAVRPDILIVDEALSVGDTYFQHKSFDRIREFRKQGTTLLIVSHDRQAIQSICDRAILLSAGQLVMEGSPEAVSDYYNAMLADEQKQHIMQTSVVDGKQRIDSGTYEAEISSVELVDEKGLPLEIVAVGQKVTVIVNVKVNKEINGLVMGFGIKDRLGQMVFGTNTLHTRQKIDNAAAGDAFVYKINFEARLGVGSFSIHCSLVENDSHVEKNYHWIDRALVFNVVNMDKPFFAGYAWNELRFDISRLQKTGY